MKIKSVETGLVNDDFLHLRVTGKAHYADDSGYYPIKIYNDGRIVGFDDQRFTGGEYEEFEIHPDILQEIGIMLNSGGTAGNEK